MKELIEKILALGVMKLVYVAVVATVGYVVFIGGSGPSAGSGVYSSSTGVGQNYIDGYIDQYNIVKRSGDQAEACTYAGVVSQLYLGIKNEGEYRRWKGISDGHCAALRNQMLNNNGAGSN
jgi:hypothetical protein